MRVSLLRTLNASFLAEEDARGPSQLQQMMARVYTPMDRHEDVVGLRADGQSELKPLSVFASQP